MASRCDGFRIWFRFPERLVIFTFGLLFGKGTMFYVLSNLTTFLTDFWKLKLKEATMIVNLQEGLRNMLQIYIAFSIDAWLGYRWMLILSSVLYSAGLGCLAFSVPKYYFKNEKMCPAEKVNCFKTLKHTTFWEGLVLVIVGAAAQVIPLYSLSFDQTKVVTTTAQQSEATRLKVACCLCKVKMRGWRHLQQRIIRLFCFGFLILGSMISVYGFIAFEDDWRRRFAISAITIAVGLIWFLSGFPLNLYGSRLLQPSPLSTLLWVLVAAERKRHLNYQGNAEQLHRGDGEENLQLTDHLKWLNKAAVKELRADEENRWTLCTVKEVEQTKLLLNIIPMSLTFIAYGIVKSLGNTLFVEQANAAEDVSIMVFQLIQMASAKSTKFVYKIVFEKRIKRTKRQYSDGLKIGIGMLSSVLCCTVAFYVDQSRRLRDLNKPIPKILLVPQFFFLGAMEGLAGDGIQDFFGHYAPDSRRYGPVFSSSLAGLGTLLSIALLAVLDLYSKHIYGTSWLGDTIEQSRLDNIYRSFTFVALLNLFFYAYVASKYSYDNIIGRPEEQEEIPFLEVKEEETPEGNQVQVELKTMPVR